MQFHLKLIDHLVAWILRYVLKYRFEVITRNLLACFAYPEKHDLEKDVKSYYLYLAKVFRQILVKPGKKLLNRRMHLEPFPALDQWLGGGKSVIVTFGHLGNWEWTGSYIGMQYPDQVCALYRKIKSHGINHWMYNRRMSHVNYLVEIKQIGELIKLVKEKSLLILMIADQNPGTAKGNIWTSFLKRNTPFVNGPESLAVRYHLPVVYIYSSPTPEGGYELKCQEIYDGVEAVAPGIIMQRFASCLEKNILEYRTQWLWSHKRWKRTEKLDSANENPLS